MADRQPPSADEIQQRFAVVAADLKQPMEVLGKRTAEMDAEDAEAAADPYGAIVLHRDPSRSDAPIFEKLCSFTEEDNTRYRDAYERLRRMIDSELLQHISDESDRLCDVLAEVLRELQSQRVSLSDQDAMDERRRRIRSALISFTAALQIHEYQTIRGARRWRRPDGSGVREVLSELVGPLVLADRWRDWRWTVDCATLAPRGRLTSSRHEWIAPNPRVAHPRE